MSLSAGARHCLECQTSHLSQPKARVFALKPHMVFPALASRMFDATRYAQAALFSDFAVLSLAASSSFFSSDLRRLCDVIFSPSKSVT